MTARKSFLRTDPNIAQLKKMGGSRKIEGNLTELPCLPEIAHAIDLAAHTGLRLGDLLRLSWSHVGEDAIVLATGKSSVDAARRSFHFTTDCATFSRAFPSAPQPS